MTLSPVASIVEQLGGGSIAVHTLLPPGAHPDTYEATPRVAEAMKDAALVVRVGGAVDGWLADGPAETLVLTDGMDLRGRSERPGPDGSGNPHVWLDPVLVRDVLLPRIETALARLVPDSAAAIRRRGT
ncbi:MAG: metal ABC transporter substrate-binding protein, partial [Gemmatimonadota bacterium]